MMVPYCFPLFTNGISVDNTTWSKLISSTTNGVRRFTIITISSLPCRHAKMRYTIYMMAMIQAIHTRVSINV